MEDDNNSGNLRAKPLKGGKDDACQGIEQAS